MFKAAALLTPFYRLANEALYDQLPRLKFVNLFHPRLVIKVPKTERTPQYQAKWGHVVNDDGQVRLITPITCINWATMQEKAKVVL